MPHVIGIMALPISCLKPVRKSLLSNCMPAHSLVRCSFLLSVSYWLLIVYHIWRVCNYWGQPFTTRSPPHVCNCSAPRERQSAFGVCSKGHIWQGSVISLLPCKEIELLFYPQGGVTLPETPAYSVITEYSPTASGVKQGIAASGVKQGIAEDRHPFHRKEHIEVI